MTAKEIEREIERVGDEARRLHGELEKLDVKLLELNNQLKEARAIQEIPDAPRLACGETYWYLSSKFVLRSNEAGYDGEREEFNYFHTERYAKEFAEKCAVIAMMLHCKWYLDRNYVQNWNDRTEEKFYLRFNHSTKEFVVESMSFIDYGGVCFSTTEAAQKCADWMNAHWETVVGLIKKGANHE